MRPDPTQVGAHAPRRHPRSVRRRLLPLLVLALLEPGARSAEAEAETFAALVVSANQRPARGYPLVEPWRIAVRLDPGATLAGAAGRDLLWRIATEPLPAESTGPGSGDAVVMAAARQAVALAALAHPRLPPPDATGCTTLRDRLAAGAIRQPWRAALLLARGGDAGALAAIDAAAATIPDGNASQRIMGEAALHGCAAAYAELGGDEAAGRLVALLGRVARPEVSDWARSGIEDAFGELSRLHPASREAIAAALPSLLAPPMSGDQVAVRAWSAVRVLMLAGTATDAPSASAILGPALAAGLPRADADALLAEVDHGALALDDHTLAALETAAGRPSARRDQLAACAQAFTGRLATLDPAGFPVRTSDPLADPEVVPTACASRSGRSFLLERIAATAPRGGDTDHALAAEQALALAWLGGSFGTIGDEGRLLRPDAATVAALIAHADAGRLHEPWRIAATLAATGDATLLPSLEELRRRAPPAGASQVLIAIARVPAVAAARTVIAAAQADAEAARPAISALAGNGDPAAHACALDAALGWISGSDDRLGRLGIDLLLAAVQPNQIAEWRVILAQLLERPLSPTRYAELVDAHPPYAEALGANLPDLLGRVRAHAQEQHP